MPAVRRGLAAAVLLAVSSAATGETPPAPAAPAATHKAVAAVEVKSADGRAKLQTLCLDGEGRVLALVAAPRPYGAPLKGATGEIHVFDADGKPVTTFTVPFHAQSLNAAPDGTIFVAGDGKVAKFDKAGKPLGAPAELPHVAALLKDEADLKARAEAQLKREQESFAKAVAQATKQFEEQVKTIEAVKEADRTKTQARQLDQAKALLKQYAQMTDERKGRTVDQVLTEMVGRVRVINAVAVSGTDVFVACGDTKGYGYSVWRMTHALADAKQVLGEVGGCCGQMDVQCCGADLLVAENTKHQFARYDRDGKKLGSFGKRGVDTDPTCFGGCCNPMNIRASAAGDIYTAESEGVIKRFSPAGEFVETAASVKLTGGCKNVALAVSPDGKKLYFCDQPGSKFHILAKN